MTRGQPSVVKPTETSTEILVLCQNLLITALHVTRRFGYQVQLELSFLRSEDLGGERLDAKSS
jgi:hypothetical protein